MEFKVGDRVIVVPAEIKAEVKEEPKKKPRKKSLRMRLYNATKGTELNSYAMRFKKGGEVLRPDTYCFSGIGTYKEYSQNTVLECVVNFKKLVNGMSKEDKARYSKYVDWVINHSPVAHCFKTKSVRIAMCSGVQMDVEKCSLSHIVTALTILREGGEFSGKLKVFDELLPFGGPTAYVVSLYVSTYRGRYERDSMNSGHKAFTPGHTLEGVKAFFKNGFPDKNEIPWQVSNDKYFTVNRSIAPIVATTGFRRFLSETLDNFVKRDANGIEKITPEDIQSYGAEIKQWLEE